jgi:hypothetical protein
MREQMSSDCAQVGFIALLLLFFPVAVLFGQTPLRFAVIGDYGSSGQPESTK